jgi:deoxyribonuclease-1-like protein
VQRILSLATLGVLGGLVWMFLSGGGLSQLATDGAAQQQGATWNDGAWPTTTPTGQAPAADTDAPPLGEGPTITIASFNIQVFGDEKAKKLEVMGTLRAIIRQFDVVAIQEIRTQDETFIPRFVEFINRPLNAGDPQRNYDAVVGPRLGNTPQKEQYAFLFDTARIHHSPTSKYTVGDPENLLHREPLVASFMTRVNPDEAFTFTLVNVHTDPSANVLAGELDALAEVYRVVRLAGGNEDDVIMLGDFNADPAHMGRLAQIPGLTPLIRNVYTNTRQNALYDNIVIHQPSTPEYAGTSSVFDVVQTFNISQSQAESVSDHFPVYARFSAYERDYAGRIASRRGTAR